MEVIHTETDTDTDTDIDIDTDTDTQAQAQTDKHTQTYTQTYKHARTHARTHAHLIGHTALEVRQRLHLAWPDLVLADLRKNFRESGLQGSRAHTHHTQTRSHISERCLIGKAKRFSDDCGV